MLVPGFDVLCVADIHKPFPPTKLETGCVVINTGILERMTREERNQTPQVAVVYSPERVEYVKLPTAKDVKELFNPAFLAEKELNEALGEEFLEKLESLSEVEEESEEDRVRIMGKELDILPESIDLVLELMK